MLPIATLNAEGNVLASSLVKELQATSEGESSVASVRDQYGWIHQNQSVSYLYVPSLIGTDAMAPDLAEAERVFRNLALQRSRKIIVLSSALIYGTGASRQALVSEDYVTSRKAGQVISTSWSILEKLALQYLSEQNKVTILRPVTLVPSPALLSRILTRRFAPTLLGHDATLQLLSPSDLANAVRCVLLRDCPGVFNVAPDRVVPMHAAIRLAGGLRIPLPRTLRRLRKRTEVLDYLRYPWTVSNQKIKSVLGFKPTKTSLTALLEARHRESDEAVQEPDFDEFGMDRDYIRFYGNNFFKFLADFYWRIEERGVKHVPRSGRGILVGMHRGFMPWDGVMALHLLVQKIGRFPRFLIHPGLLKFPFLANFMTKLGGVIACQESADRVLESNELLGVFPEGIQGAFTPYRDSYQLQGFGRNAFVKMALLHRAPIIPFVTVGSAEIFPILGKIESKLWHRYAEWPFIPLTPTFPILPLPLPAKWHTMFLPPLHVERTYPPEAAHDRSVVKAISLEVRMRMQQAIDEMLAQRRSIFWGSAFKQGDST
ncbi:MAG: 1-acyl-sn-glycerol-3-phosphate acyltransferase [Acidobacteriia bacterium]|nr:1-acyl-sn-glycerol-3-phosphate acyltransferase [Terriglobia bacterium]